MSTSVRGDEPLDELTVEPEPGTGTESAAQPAGRVHAGGHAGGRDGEGEGEGDENFRHSYTKDRAVLLRRLKRIEGQVRGISRMIEREEYCVDILQQTSALRAAVDALGVLILEDHVRGCLRQAAEQGGADEMVDEVIDVVRRTIGRPVRTTGRG